MQAREPSEEAGEGKARPDSRASDTVLLAPGSRPKAANGFGSRRESGSAGPSSLDLLERIGSGSMGEVLLGRDRILWRKVAYKRLHSELRCDPDMVQRLLAEAQITAQLDHPNVVPLHTLELEDHQPAGYVMKLVEGKTLAELIDEASAMANAEAPLPSSLRRATLIEHFLKVCDAMAFAHAKGVIHRDLKPANIMVGRFGEVHIMDWGIACSFDHSAYQPDGSETPVRYVCSRGGTTVDAPAWGSLIGTPRYMSPEQARGEINRLDPRSDLYSLGLILFELVCLKPAYGGSDRERLLERVRGAQRSVISAPSKRLPVPYELKAVIAKATAAEPTDRYADVSALARDLRGFLRGESISAVRDSLVRKVLRWIGHHRQAAFNLFMITLLLAALTMGGMWHRHMEVMAELQQRQAQMMHYLDVAASQAQGIEQHFQFIFGLLEGLAAGAELALEHGRPVNSVIYQNEDFVDPATAPPDLAVSRLFTGMPSGLPISVAHPGVFLPSGELPPETDADVRKLLALASLLRRIFLEADGQPPVPGDHDRLRDALHAGGMPINWAAVALRTGPMIYYPGHGGFASDYDPRKRPWYRAAMLAGGSKVCVEPYLSAIPETLIISCGAALHSDAGESIGVAVLDLPLAERVAELLITPDLPLIRGLLVDEEGRILMQASPGKEHTRFIASEPLHAYEDDRLVAAVQAGRSGVLERLSDGRQIWVIYIALPELEWTYIAELDPRPNHPVAAIQHPSY